MTTRYATRAGLLWFAAAAAAGAITSIAVNPRLALLATTTAVALCLTRLRFAALAGVVLLLAVAALSLVAPHDAARQRITVGAARAAVRPTSPTHSRRVPSGPQRPRSGGRKR
jgi:hypothetical protein